MLVRKPRKGAVGLPALSGAAVAGAGPALAVAEGSMDPQVLRARITRALQENPEEVKRLFVNWVESDKAEV